MVKKSIIPKSLSSTTCKHDGLTAAVLLCFSTRGNNCWFPFYESTNYILFYVFCESVIFVLTLAHAYCRPFNLLVKAYFYLALKY